jgi:hypothetical protein
MTADDDPIFNLADEEQWNRVAGHLQSLRRHAVEDREGDRKHFYRVRITKASGKYTTAQMGYLWAVVYPHIAKAVRETGQADYYTSADAHDELKPLFLSQPIVDKRTGEIIARTKPPSVGSLSKVEMIGYIDALISYAADRLDCKIPPPDKFYSKQEWDDESKWNQRRIPA